MSKTLRKPNMTDIQMDDATYAERMERLSYEIRLMAAASFNPDRTAAFIKLLTYELAINGTGLEFSGVVKHGAVERIGVEALHKSFDNIRKNHPLSDTRYGGRA